MADFYAAHKIVMAHEGGYANNPSDRGGETYKGIARKFHPDWDGWSHVDKATSLANSTGVINKLLEDDAVLQQKVLAFYKLRFWDVMSLDDVENQKIATELYDTGVNMGWNVAGNFLQTALNVSNKNGKSYPDLVKDGRIGSKTISTLNNHPRPDDVFKLLNCLQGARYISICEANPSQEIFLRSWLSRVSL